eukprot:ctg_771.g302
MSGETCGSARPEGVRHGERTVARFRSVASAGDRIDDAPTELPHFPNGAMTRSFRRGWVRSEGSGGIAGHRTRSVAA